MTHSKFVIITVRQIERTDFKDERNFGEEGRNRPRRNQEADERTSTSQFETL